MDIPDNIVNILVIHQYLRKSCLDKLRTQFLYRSRRITGYNLRLRDCIVPRTEIVACDTSATDRGIRVLKFIETGLSKILVYNENIRTT